MTTATLTCPHCGSKLTVTSLAPRAVTCPRCLYRLVNPIGGGPATVLAPPPLPMKVLPLETQAHGDSRTIITMLCVLLALLTCGAFFSAAAGGIDGATFNFLLLLILAAFTAIVIVASVRRQKRDRDVAEAVAKMPQLPPSERELLAYQSPYKYSPYTREPTNGWAAAGGFFVSIGLCAGGFFLLAATTSLSSSSSSSGGASARGFLLLIVIAAVITYMIGIPALSRRPGWRGFGTGATIGLVLGMLALGPCAFCYLITLTA